MAAGPGHLFPTPCLAKGLPWGPYKASLPRGRQVWGQKERGPDVKGRDRARSTLFKKQHPRRQSKAGQAGRQARGQRSSSLPAAPTSHPIYCNRQDPEKRPSPLPSAPPHLTEPLVLVFILPAFKPSLGEEDSNRKSKGPRTSTGQVLRTGGGWRGLERSFVSHAILESGGPFKAPSTPYPTPEVSTKDPDGRCICNTCH